MNMIQYIKNEIAIVRERDPAIHSSMEVLLYPSFWAVLEYRLAHRLYVKKHFFWPGLFPALRQKNGY